MTDNDWANLNNALELENKAEREKHLSRNGDSSNTREERSQVDFDNHSVRQSVVIKKWSELSKEEKIEQVRMDVDNWTDWLEAKYRRTVKLNEWGYSYSDLDGYALYYPEFIRAVLELGAPVMILALFSFNIWIYVVVVILGYAVILLFFKDKAYAKIRKKIQSLQEHERRIDLYIECDWMWIIEQKGGGYSLNFRKTSAGQELRKLMMKRTYRVK